MSEKQKCEEEKNSITQHAFTQDILQDFLYGKKKRRIVDIHGRERTKRKCEGVADDSRRIVKDLWCADCCKHIDGECLKHPATPQPRITYAVGSFPPEVQLCTSSIPEYTYGACAAKKMPRGTWIGPYEGKRVFTTRLSQEKDNSYIWEIYENGEFSHFLDGSDENSSSWMRFIRCARHKKEQNMSVVQYRKNIYYFTTEDINIGDELLVWYHESYHQFWGVPLTLQHEMEERTGPPLPLYMMQPINMNVGTSSKTRSPNFTSSYNGAGKSPFVPPNVMATKERPRTPPPHPQLTTHSNTEQPHSSYKATVPGYISTQYLMSKTNPTYQSSPAAASIKSLPYTYPLPSRYPSKSAPGIQQYLPTHMERRPSLEMPSNVERNIVMGQPVSLVAPLRKLPSVIPQAPAIPCTSTSTLQDPSSVPYSTCYKTSEVFNGNIQGNKDLAKTLNQWKKVEVKENMPLAKTRDEEVIEVNFKSGKDISKTTPLKNLNTVVNEKQISNDVEKQHSQVSSTVRNTSEQDFSWTCGQCGEIFAQQVSLRMHVCKKLPDNPFHCGHCSNTFATSSELREHVVTHSNERPFKCGFCGRSFAGATTLGNHMRTHTGQRPYECKVCGQTFAIATQLSRHLKPPGECGLKQMKLNGQNQNLSITVEQ